METLNFQPDWGLSMERKPELMKISFGDGYEQVGAKGLNHNRRIYSAVFSGTKEKIEQIEAFFNRQGGYKVFNWTPYSGEAGKFRCDEWSSNLSSSKCSLSATIREVVL